MKAILPVAGLLYGFVFRGNRYDAGDKFDFIKATLDLSLKRPEFSEGVRDYIFYLASSLSR